MSCAYINHMYIIYQTCIYMYAGIDYSHNHIIPQFPVHRLRFRTFRSAFYHGRRIFSLQSPSLLTSSYRYIYIKYMLLCRERKTERSRESTIVRLWTSGKRLPFTNVDNIIIFRGRVLYRV